MHLDGSRSELDRGRQGQRRFALACKRRRAFKSYRHHDLRLPRTAFRMRRSPASGPRMHLFSASLARRFGGFCCVGQPHCERLLYAVTQFTRLVHCKRGGDCVLPRWPANLDPSRSSFRLVICREASRLLDKRCHRAQKSPYCGLMIQTNSIPRIQSESLSGGSSVPFNWPTGKDFHREWRRATAGRGVQGLPRRIVAWGRKERGKFDFRSNPLGSALEDGGFDRFRAGG